MTSSHSGSSDSSDSSDSSGAKGCTVLAITTTLATLNLQCQDMSSTAGVSLPSTPTQYTLPLRTSFCAHMIYVHCTSYMVSNCEGTKEYNLKLDVSWCLADLHFIPLLHQSPTFSWRWLSHATKRSTRRSKSRRDSRRPRREQKKTYRNVNVNNMEISWKYHGKILNIIESCGHSSFPFVSLIEKTGCMIKAAAKANYMSPQRCSFLSRPSLANKRLDSCTVMWRHSSGTYHQTWQDLTWSAQLEGAQLEG
jgi:hypothetical protein